jgi:sulfhydrogenase subunit delta
LIVNAQTAQKPRVGIFGLTGCAGDQLALLNAEPELIALAGRVEIVVFDMAISLKEPWQGKLDLALVEGSVCSQRDRQELEKIRQRSRNLMAIGSCAVWGGLPAMTAHVTMEQLKQRVYGDKEVFPQTIGAEPLSRFVPVDFSIPGCPIEIEELLEALGALLAGGEPRRIDFPVCAECRMAEQVCLVQSQKQLCCGPVTVGGCKARCIGYGHPCDGCRGPVDDPHYDTVQEMFLGHGLAKGDVVDALKRFSSPAWVARNLAPDFAADPQRRGHKRTPIKEAGT